MKVINGNVLVEIIKKERKTSGGIIVTENIMVDDEGIVVEVDPEITHIVSARPIADGA